MSLFMYIHTQGEWHLKVLTSQDNVTTCIDIYANSEQKRKEKKMQSTLCTFSFCNIKLQHKQKCFLQLSMQYKQDLEWDFTSCTR